ncbi:MAG TPA: acyltransferase [Rhizomicrobium sp.]|jgi:peptidoglycan/LPS O-acetylase OafA/YrhL|nr:acyltransferase [Rhizomicrobium sp.]
MFKALKPESDRLLHLDCLRLFASFAIIFDHAKDRLEIGSWWTNTSATTFGDMGLFVDLFFVISGYVIAFIYFDRMRTPRDYGAFLQKRAARLVPLHWLLLAVYVVLGYVAVRASIHINGPEIFDPHCLAANALLLHATGLCPHLSYNVPSWSISAEFMMYLLAPVVFWLVRRSLLMSGAIIAMLFVVLPWFELPGQQWMFWTSHFGAVRALPSFLYGAMLYQARDRVKLLPGAAYAIVVLLVAFFAACTLQLYPAIPLLILYAVATAAVAADNQRVAGGLVHTAAAGAQLTYSSYMLHEIVLTVLLTMVAGHVLHLHGTAMNLMVVLGIALIWPLSYLSLELFERPMRRVINGLGRRTPKLDEEKAANEFAP